MKNQEIANVLQGFSQLQNSFSPEIATEIFGEDLGQHFYREYIADNRMFKIWKWDLKSYGKVSDYIHKKYILKPTENELLEFTIPQWAVCALINGDPIEEGTDEQNTEDEQKISAFNQRCIEKYGNANFMTGDKSEAKTFRPSNDIDHLASDCVCVTLYLSNEKS
jgi:hypothetical protein